MSSGNKYKVIASKIKFEGRAFINGKYVNAIDGKKFETINPATGKKLCAVARCNHKDCLLYTSPSPRDQRGSRMPSSA